MQAAHHPREAARLSRLRSSGILDTPRERRFERIVFTAAQVAKVPIALINLVDEHRQWSKALVGTSRREISRDAALCSHTILQTDMLIVEDTRFDPRFVDNALVMAEPGIRFYAGVPLRSSDDLPLGALCVIDRQPRRLSPEQVRILKMLAHEVEEMLYPMELDP